MGVVDSASLAAVFQATVDRNPERTALRTLDDSERLTWGQYHDEVMRVARGFAAFGVSRGDVVATMLSNQPAFHVADTAALHLGATGLTIYNTLPAEDVAWALNETGASIVVTEPAMLDVIRDAGAETIVLIGDPEPGTVAWNELDGDREIRWQRVGHDDRAVIIYTSGTTSRPKGVELTHRAILGNVQGLHHAIGTKDGARVVSYLPMAHIAERQLSHYRGMAFGLEVTTCSDHRRMPEYLRSVRPHYFFAPPRMLDKFRAAAPSQGILETFGLDQVEVALTGSAPVPPELTQFWIDAGLPLVEAWGITECGAFGAFGRPGNYRVGTCGQPLPGVELQLAEDGEILVRSPWLMRGYLGRPKDTAEAIDSEGWLHTGDIGEWDDGHLRIIDRKKEIIINAAGKNMSPAHIEARIKESHPLIGEACVIGDGRPYNVALIVRDPDVTVDGDEANAYEEGIATANRRLARVEQIKRYHVLDHVWTPGSDVLTPTMKLKRRVIAKRYAAEIEALYRD
jgi:long-chain acyl-CoA synthetase